MGGTHADARLICSDGDNSFVISANSADNSGIRIYARANDMDEDFYLNSVSLKQIQGNPGMMINMASDDKVSDVP